MSNKEIFRTVKAEELDAIRSRWNFVPADKYAGMIPVKNEVGSLVDIPYNLEVLRGGKVDGATVERLVLDDLTM